MDLVTNHGLETCHLRSIAGTGVVFNFKIPLLMATQSKKETLNTEEEKDKKLSDKNLTAEANMEDAVEEDVTPVLDEKDLEENHIDEEEAENIEWKSPKKK